MKVTLHSTDKIVTLNEAPARVREGVTESGQAVHAYVTRIALPNSAPPEEHARFERELQEARRTSAEVEAIPQRMII